LISCLETPKNAVIHLQSFAYIPVDLCRMMNLVNPIKVYLH